MRCVVCGRPTIQHHIIKGDHGFEMEIAVHDACRDKKRGGGEQAKERPDHTTTIGFNTAGLDDDMVKITNRDDLGMNKDISSMDTREKHTLKMARSTGKLSFFDLHLCKGCGEELIPKSKLFCCEKCHTLDEERKAKATKDGDGKTQ